MGSGVGVTSGLGEGEVFGAAEGSGLGVVAAPVSSNRSISFPSPCGSSLRWAIAIVRPLRPSVTMESAAPGSQTDMALAEALASRCAPISSWVPSL